MEESLLNDIIDRLLDVRNGRPGKQVQLTEAEIKQLCMTAKEIFMGQPNLLELEAPIKICGQSFRLCPTLRNTAVQIVFAWPVVVVARKGTPGMSRHALRQGC